ncbi:hypothetical protein [Paraburkholderia phenoliruptrix]|uniref:Replication protein O n=1 Tax=Paraburkholderia phenoliruptrix TaxID=252970 RepID=A0ABV3WK39_9BURK
MMPGCHPYITGFEALWTVLRPHRPIAFGTRLARITGHPKDALLLSQLVYWTRRGRDVEANGGWIHKTREHWLLETGLSREEQENARRRLRNMNLLTEWRGGQPARMHYRLEVEAISHAVRENCRMVSELPWSIEAMRTDEFASEALLGPTIAYRRIFADLVGNVNAALLLSRMVQLQRREADRQCTWFTLTAGEWQRTLGLNRRQLDNARARLVRQGLIRELMRQCTGRRVFTQVNADELKRQFERLVSRGDMRERLATRKRLLARSLSEKHNGVSGARPATVIPGNSGASLAPLDETIHVPFACAGKGARQKLPTGSPPLQAKHGVAPAAPRIRLAGLVHYRWRQTCVPDARVYGTTTYRTTTTIGLALMPFMLQEMPKSVSGIHLSPMQSGATADVDPIVWPVMVAAADRALIAAHLARIPVVDWQVLLDEMAAGHRYQPVQLPVAYIAGLVRRYLAGEFIATRAHLERTARERATRGEEMSVRSRHRREDGDSPPSTRETACQHLAAIRHALRAQMAHRPACQADPHA